MSARDELAEVIDQAMGRYIDPSQVAAAADAVLSHLAGKGGITDEQILTIAGNAVDAHPPDTADEIEALLAQQAAVDAARIAELKLAVQGADFSVSRFLAVKARVEELEDERWTVVATRNTAIARAKAAEAQVARVRDTLNQHWDWKAGLTLKAAIGAALDGEGGR